jgi:hypothetical protein
MSDLNKLFNGEKPRNKGFFHWWSMWTLGITLNPFRWHKPQFTIYDYDGNDGRKVTDYMAYFGPFHFTKDRIANNRKIIPAVRQIIHISVGGPDFTPTGEDLDAIRDRFLNEPVPAYDSSTVSFQAYHVRDSERVVITAGNVDWQPTKEELDALASAFNNARFGSGVLVTRDGVEPFIL